MPSQALPGFRDFYPDELELRAHIFRTWREVARRYGFEEYDGPPLEPLDIYTAKSGSEIVGQLYNFTDKGGREVALRPEMTPTFARMVTARANGLRKPIRWFSIPQLFRYERQQRGRLREHFQLNCDLVGEAGPLADAELIALSIDVMRAFGLTERDVRARVSDRRVLGALLAAAGVSAAHLGDAYQAIDKAERSRPGELAAQLRSAGLGDAVIEKVFAVAAIRGRPALEAALAGLPDAGAAASLLTALDALDAMGLGAYVDVDLSIVRGLAYYTGTVFELFDAGRTLRAICGGGRYDGLLLALGGVDLPALGFGMGDVVLGELLRERGLAPPARAEVDVFVAAVTPEDIPHALALAHELRDAGLACEFALAAQPLGRQLKQADARGARRAIVIGPDDRARGEVVLKDLAGKTQAPVRRDAVLAAVAAGDAGAHTGSRDG
ncbi:MAG TPA: histidine--tRNA ligase [Gemmatimonadales bacterium]|jgi:histidyl-tRNA synthetase|nr:histidine--tRNA ligase [Gemmatimonadales bacterium]